jgi:hypothetical protein
VLGGADVVVARKLVVGARHQRQRAQVPASQIEE